jgi:dihydrofolate reductase
MRTQYYTATTLDGFIAGPDHELDWLLELGDPETSSYSGFIAGIGALAMGSGTYEWLLREHVRPAGKPPAAWPYEQPVWVFSSRRLERIEDADIHYVSGDVRPVHVEMAAAAAGKDAWIVGGGDLVGQFHDHGLLDEVIVQIAPVTLGAGKPLLPRRIAQPPLRLRAVERFGEFVELRYEVGRQGA